MSNIPKGYKQTEVGVIPEDWEAKRLGDFFTFSGGYTASRDQLSNDGYCYLHYGDIHGANKTFIDVKKEYSEIPKLNIPIKKVSPKSLLNEGDVVFVDASEDNEGASKHIVVFNSDGIPFISGLHTIVSKSKNDIIDNGYKRYCFQPYYVKSQFKFYAVGTKVTGISKTNIAKVLMSLPSTKAEQAAIATTLSDADALIQSLEKLIVKKRDIKQGAMQELLKPKEGWVGKKLGEIGTFSKGQGIRKDECMSGAIPCIRYGELYTRHNDYVKQYYSFISDNVAQRAKKLKPGDILFAGSGETKEEIGKCAAFIDNTEAYAGGDIVILSPVNVNSLFLGFYLNTPFVVKQKASKGQGDAVVHISAGNLKDIEIPIPPLSEQTRIAAILSDMDAEISALETKLAKYKQIKQGMMQELLTGRIRLL